MLNPPLSYKNKKEPDRFRSSFRKSIAVAERSGWIRLCRDRYRQDEKPLHLSDLLSAIRLRKITDTGNLAIFRKGVKRGTHTVGIIYIVIVIRARGLQLVCIVVIVIIAGAQPRVQKPESFRPFRSIILRFTILFKHYRPMFRLLFSVSCSAPSRPAASLPPIAAAR